MTAAIAVAAVHPNPTPTPTTTNDDGDGNDSDDDEDLPHVDRAKEVLGFDPRRFFDKPLHTRVRGAMNPVERMAGIIRGLDRKQKVACLMAVEQNLDRSPPSGRDTVMDMLEDRMEFLDEHGERPDLRTASIDERPPRYTPALRDRTVPPKNVYIVEDDGTRVPYSEKRGSSAAAKLNNHRNTSTGGDDA